MKNSQPIAFTLTFPFSVQALLRNISDTPHIKAIINIFRFSLTGLYRKLFANIMTWSSHHVHYICQLLKTIRVMHVNLWMASILQQRWPNCRLSHRNRKTFSRIQFYCQYEYEKETYFNKYNIYWITIYRRNCVFVLIPIWHGIIFKTWTST